MTQERVAQSTQRCSLDCGSTVRPGEVITPVEGRGWAHKRCAVLLPATEEGSPDSVTVRRVVVYRVTHLVPRQLRAAVNGRLRELGSPVVFEALHAVDHHGSDTFVYARVRYPGATDVRFVDGYVAHALGVAPADVLAVEVDVWKEDA